MAIPVPSAGPSPSAFTILLARNPVPSNVSPHHHALALQILHNLQYQHDWTHLKIHYHSPLPSFRERASLKPLPRPLISGLPPTRIYIHPDEQAELFRAGKKGKELAEVREREWVLPSQIREKWSLRMFANCFDNVGEVPEGGKRMEGLGDKETEENDQRGIGAEETDENEDQRRKIRKGGKRMLLATVCDDSTVVYYIVHDGIVKPRQN